MIRRQFEDKIVDSPPLILLVDDNMDLCIILQESLVEEGLRCHKVYTASDALAFVHDTVPDVIVLDIQLPDGSGLDVLAELKSLMPDIEVVMFTGTDTADSAKQAIRTGAFEYVVKESNNIEQLITIIQKACCQRRKKRHICLEHLRINLDLQIVLVDDVEVSLTPTEWSILRCLSSQCGRLVEYPDLWRKIWSDSAPIDKDLIQRTVSNLRKRIGVNCIKTVRGKGYTLE